MNDAAARLAVALDAPDLGGAERLAQQLAGRVGVLKVGLELFTAHGPAAVVAAAKWGAEVFLDLKVHDIPRTAAAAIRSAAALGVRHVTLHALGGPAMIAAAREAAEAAQGTRPMLLAVTVLTSHGPADLQRLGLSGTPAEAALRLSRLALEAGADGLVASAQEAALLRQELGSRPFLATPGIRLRGGAAGDQVRIATPAQAIRHGADLLVVGRPIVAAVDPAAAAAEILADITAALGGA